MQKKQWTRFMRDNQPPKLLMMLHSAESFAEPRPGWFLACHDDIIRSCRLTHMR